MGTIVALHYLYIKILCQFWRLKRRQSRERKKSTSTSGSGLTSSKVFGSSFQSLFDQDPESPCIILSVRNLDNPSTQFNGHLQPGSLPKLGKRKSLQKTLAKVQVFAQAAKYVVVILVAFTLCWLPWIVTYFGDILLHVTDCYSYQIRNKCDYDNFDHSNLMLGNV